ncbi:MAG: hypothetical protein RBT16_11230 [Desulfococcus multivorans]|jgi:hypothetical protein|uniref:hypothetical protein n=1 Tax=Desulfococcus sp. TaxID=2025834 RepID=UPI002A472154|nr:hypothetical protein [Desulfococcus multivorans]
MQVPIHLLDQIRESVNGAPSSAMDRLIQDIFTRFDGHVQGILFYGSCLRKENALDGLADLYVLVDTYRTAYRNACHAFLNHRLPPNVYYHEASFDGLTVRAKYAVISLEDFQKGTTDRWFHSYLWGRFCQPCRMIYARDAATADAVVAALAQAVVTFVSRVLPCMPPVFTARELWGRGLELSYRAELRSERPDRQVRLVDADPGYFEAATRHVLGGMPRWTAVPMEADGRFRTNIPKSAQWVARAAWRLRTVQGKLLSILRLLKATMTFEGGVDYILWKIERHSGVTVAAEPRLRRHPILAAGVLAWRAYRSGGFR